MEKKHISIIGTCMSRNLFNVEPFCRVFDIDNYIFQISPWTLCYEGLSVDSKVFLSMQIPEFTKRMYEYDINKTVLKEIENKKSEYLFIDLHSIIGSIYKFYYDDKVTYCQSSFDENTEKLKNELYQHLQNFSFEKFSISNFDKTLIVEGLKKFSIWVTKNFKQENTIIYVPEKADRYFSTKGTIECYDNYRLNKKIKDDSTLLTYSNILHSLLPNSKIYYDCAKKIAQFEIFDTITDDKTPPSTHFSIYDNLKTGLNILDLLHIQIKEYYQEPIDIIQYALIKQKFDYWKLYKKFKNIIDSNNLQIKKYINNIKDLEKIIIIFSVKDSSHLLKNNLSLLGLKNSLKYRESYIAIIDKSRNFIYENSSLDKMIYNYSVNDTFINIQSAGYNVGNISSVKIGADGENLSLNKIGLNIVIINSKTLEVLDQAHCDTCNDDDLIVDSQYFRNIKIKI